MAAISWGGLRVQGGESEFQKGRMRKLRPFYFYFVAIARMSLLFDKHLAKLLVIISRLEFFFPLGAPGSEFAVVRFQTVANSVPLAGTLLFRAQ